MSLIRLDGEPHRVQDGTTLGDLLPDHDFSCVVAVIRPGTGETRETESLRLSTTVGEIVVEIFPQGRTLLPVGIPTATLHWQDRSAVAFGPFPSAIAPARIPALAERGDIILGCGGYDPARSYLIFSRRRHTADHGTPAGGGVIGRVVSGRGILDRFGEGDRILSTNPVVNIADTSRSFSTRDRTLVLEEGMEIVTRIDMTAWGYTPESVSPVAAVTVEHLLLALKEGKFHVERALSNHIRDGRHVGTDLSPEVRGGRREGTVTVRVAGTGPGSIYITTADLPASSAHSIVGQVTHGIEVARLARTGDVIEVRCTPPRLDLLGMPFPEAVAQARSRGVRVETDSGEEKRVVISQEPGTTLESLAEGVVRLGTEPLSRVVDITLDDRAAPESCEVFRRITGLHHHEVGQIPFSFHFEDVYLFRPRIPRGVKIIPENTPSGEVPAGTLAITNDSRKGSGMVGIRLVPHREFGPTSEPFEGTNIIGRVLDMEKLPQFQEKDTVFIREVRRS